MGDGLKYWAFLSYSHADKSWAKWLHRALETYNVPRHLIGRATPGGKIPRKIQPVFRDRDELPVSTDLSATVRAALQQSRYLIVLCSPDAARSKWVDQEILEFRAARGEENILCAIVGRAPSANEDFADPNAGVFPDAVMKGEERAEPLAADLRRGYDGKRLGKLKVIAGLLGIGLDELVQRDLQRRHRRLLGLTAAMASGMAVMAFLALSAINSQREEAREKARAEELVEFMLGDLRNQLKPVGSLDTLASLSEQALQYYTSLNPDDLDAEDKQRRARALLAIGEIENLRGDIDKATIVFTDAFEITLELLTAAPNDTARIFDHAQSVYWLGYNDYQYGRLDKAESAFAEYMRLSKRLTELEPGNRTWRTELASAHVNLGVLQLGRGQTEAAIQSLSAGRDILEEITDFRPDDTDSLSLLANTHAWIADVQESQGDLNAAFDSRASQTAILENLHRGDPGNTSLSADLVAGWRHLGRLWLGRGDLTAAERQFSRSIELGRLLLQLDSTNTFWRDITGRSLLAYADLLLWGQRSNEAEQVLGEAEEIARWLLEQDGNVLDWQVWLACQAEQLRARLEQSEGRSAVALDRLGRLIDRLSGLAVQHPDNRDVGSLLAAAHFYSGRILAGTDQLEEARTHWRRVVDTLDSSDTPLPLADRASLALGYLRLDRIERASVLAIELEQLGFRHPMTSELRRKVGASEAD